MSYIPTFDLSSLGVLIGTVGASGGVVAGNTAIGPVGFTPLPGRTTADSFTFADIGRRITIMGAGPGGTLLITTITGITSSQRVTVADAPSVSIADGISAVTVYRPAKVKLGSMSFAENLTDATEGQFTVQQLNGEPAPVEGQPFLFTSDDPALKDSYGTFWGGEIDSVELSYEGYRNGTTKVTETLCKCVSYKAVLQRRVMLGKQYSSTDIVTIANDICAQATADYIDCTVPSNASISLLTVDDYTYLDQAMDALVNLASAGATKYFWYIDHWRKVHLVTETSSPAPWSVSDTGASDGNVEIKVSRERTREKLANQVYAKASKALGDLQSATFSNVFNGAALPQPRRALTLPAKAGITPKITVNGVSKKVWVSPIDPRNDTSGTVTIPAGYDWAWPEDTDYLFCDGSRPGIPSGGTGIVTFYPTGTAISHDLNTSSVTQRAAIQGGSGLHEAVETVDAPMSKSELDTWVTGHVQAFGVVPESVNVSTYRAGLRRGMGLTVHLTEIGATVNYIVESVSMGEEQGYVHWVVKASLGAFIGDWTGALIRAFGGDTSLGGGVGVVNSGSVLEAQFVGGSGMETVPYQAKVLVNGGTQSYSFAVATGDSLPTGLTLDTVTGIISGTPTTAGSYDFDIAVLDADGDSVVAVCHVEVATAPSNGSAELLGTITSFTAADNVGARWVNYPGDGSLHAVTDITVSCNAYPKRITITEESPQYGHTWHGWFKIDGPATIVSLGAKGSNTTRFPPTTSPSETVTFRAAVGVYDKNFDLTGLGVGNYSQTTCSVGGPGSYSTTGNIVLTTPVVNYYRTVGGAYVYTITFQATLPLSDKKFFYFALYNQTGIGSGGSFTPAGANAGNTRMGNYAAPTAYIPEPDHADIYALDTVVGTGKVNVTLGPWNVPNDGINTIRLTAILATRQDNGSGGTEFSQYSWPGGGVQYFDVLLDPSKAKIDATEFDPTTLNPSVGVDANGDFGINTTNIANITYDASFRSGTLNAWIPSQTGAGTAGVVSSGGHNGGSFARLVADVTPAGNSFNYLLEKVLHECSVGDPIHAEGWVLFGNGATGNGHIQLWFYDSGGSLISSYVPDVAVLSSTVGSSWYKLSVNGIAPANACTFRVVFIYVEAHSALINPFMNVDDVVTTVQPSTSVQAATMAAASITYANQAVAGNALVDSNIASINIGKLVSGTVVFSGDIVMSRGSGQPVMVMNNAGIYLYGAGNASGVGVTPGVAGNPSYTASGLTNNGYVAITASAVGVYGPVSGFTQPAVIINGFQIGIYADSVSLTARAYATFSATALDLYAGGSGAHVQLTASQIIMTAGGSALPLIIGVYSGGSGASISVTGGLQLVGSSIVGIGNGSAFVFVIGSQLIANTLSCSVLGINQSLVGTSGAFLGFVQIAYGASGFTGKVPVYAP